MRDIYGLYFCCCYGEYINIIKEQMNLFITSGLYEKSKNILIYLTLYNEETDILNLFKIYDSQDKFIYITTSENSHERFALNNYRDEIKKISNDPYYLYYFHTKGISYDKDNKYYDNVTCIRKIMNHYTLTKHHLNTKLLENYDAVGCSLMLFPKIHFSGNFWWSKSENLELLEKVDELYLSPEMYVCSNMSLSRYDEISKTPESFGKYFKFVSLSQDANKNLDVNYHMHRSDDEIMNNITNVPIIDHMARWCDVNFRYNKSVTER